MKDKEKQIEFEKRIKCGVAYCEDKPNNQIEEMAKIVCDACRNGEHCYCRKIPCEVAEKEVKALYEQGYRKLDDHAIMTLRKAKGLEERTRKETAEKILKLADKKLDLYRNGVIGGSIYDSGYQTAIYDIKRTIKELFSVEIKE